LRGNAPTHMPHATAGHEPGTAGVLRQAGRMMPGLSRRVFMLACAGLLTGCGDQEWQWNVKVTVNVDTPEGVRTGYSVVRVGVRKYSGLQRKFGYAYGAGVIEGEAVVVDLGDGRYLFALVVAGNMAYRASEVVFDDLLPEEDAARYRKMQRLRVRREVPREMYPLLVTFDDINDPKTVKRVDPDNLEATFGAGYRLKSITLEITDEPVTKGRVEKVLGWLGNYKIRKYRLNGEKCVACPKDKTLTAMLGASDFEIGE